jgi:hypothetical protein
MTQGMTTDYKQESLHTVAIKFPATGKPSFLRSSYNEKTWQFMVLRAHNDKSINAYFVMDDTEEGQAILQGTDTSDISPEFLVGLDEPVLREMADRYEIKHTAKNNKKAIALKIMAAIADGVKPKAVPELIQP